MSHPVHCAVLPLRLDRSIHRSIPSDPTTTTTTQPNNHRAFASASPAVSALGLDKFGITRPVRAAACLYVCTDLVGFEEGIGQVGSIEWINRKSICR